MIANVAEVFKPRIVQAVPTESYHTQIEPQVRRIEEVIGAAITSEDKQKNTANIIHRSALTYDGSIITQKFTSERKWLEKKLEAFDPNSIVAPTKKLVSFIADHADYWNHFIRPRNPRADAESFTLVNYLVKLGLNSQQSNKAAFCIFYLKDSNHSMAHTVLSTFFSKLKRSPISSEENVKAASDFFEACLATTAFFTLWKGAGASGFPDQEYRELFSDITSNMSIERGTTNQNIGFLKERFRIFLQRKDIYDAINPEKAEDKWVSKAKDRAWYRHKASTRFGLFIAAQDTVPSTMIHDEGFYTKNLGRDILEPKNWFSEDFKSIEHVATQTPPVKQNYPDFFDKDIYPDTTNSNVDKIGNLTLINRRDNSALQYEWPEKAYYYWSMTTPVEGAIGITDEELKEKLRITSIPPRLATLKAAEASTYSQILAPIVYRAQKGLPWDLPFINRRSKHLCECIFEKLDAWLR